jgi:predicted murein hydrolase (TIGR00659 family)
MSSQSISSILSSPLFGILLSVGAFQLGTLIYKRTRFVVFNPILVAAIIVIAFLVAFSIPYDDYKIGGSYISFFLGPATVVLAVPLYRKIDLLKKHMIPILAGVFAGSLASVGAVISMGILFRMDPQLIVSLMPKSVTMPIGVEMSKTFGGLEQITILSIVVTGISGAIVAPGILKLLRITNRIAMGIAIGTSSHAVGTSKAMEMGETEGAMSGLAIGVAGMMTVFIIPLLVILFPWLRV